MGYNKENLKTPELRKGRHDRAERRERHRSEAEENKRAISDAAAALMDLSSAGNCFDDSYTQLDADTEDSPPKKKDSTELDGCLQEMANLRLRNQLLVQELSRLQEENRRKKEEAEASKFGAGYLRRGNSTQRTAFYTGLPNLAVFEWLVSYVRDSLPHFDSVTVEDAILIVLMKIRLNTPNFDLGCRFGVSSTTISDILNKCIPVVAQKLSPFIHWPDKEDVLRTLPSLFKGTYKNTRVIIDCTEVFIERPGNLTARAATWSNYKSNNTLKYLVGITPCGAISFVSRAFGGRTSDKVVTQRSGFLDLLQHSDVVMADRGFLIQEDILARNCYLVIPSFTRGKTQLSQKQVEVSRQMSRLRIHVERAIQRLKTFKS